MALLVTPVLAATGEVSPVPVSPADQTDTHKATEATSPAPFHALNRLDAQTLAEHEMTDQELKAVEGGFMIDPPEFGVDIYGAFLLGFWRTCGC
jgi:bacteriocin-like protein